LEHHRVVLSTIPIVLLCIMVRIALEVSPLQFSGIFSSETVTPFTTVSMFVIAIMLGGIMEDYKEAERLPADMVSALDSVSEKLAFCQLTTLRAKQVADKEKSEQQHRHHGGDGGGEPCCCCKRAKAGEEKEREEELAVFDSRAEHTELLAYVTCVLEYFACMRTDQDILAITSMYAKYFAMRVNESAEVTHTESWEIFEAFDDLRTSLLRMSVIKNTNFIPSGHRLMQVLVTATVILVTLARYDNGSPDVPGGGGGRRLWGAADSPDSSHEQWFIENVSAYCNVGTYVFLFIYVLFLIDDLEDPFECVGGGAASRSPRTAPAPFAYPRPFFPHPGTLWAASSPASASSSGTLPRAKSRTLFGRTKRAPRTWICSPFWSSTRAWRRWRTAPRSPTRRTRWRARASCMASAAATNCPWRTAS
jgi:hypothetical protein